MPEITDSVTKYQCNEGVSPIGYIVWYGDGTSYRIDKLTRAEWDKLPKDNVQIIMVFENTRDGQGRPTRVYMGGCDYYTYDGKDFQMANDTRVLTKNTTILYGRWLEDEEFKEIQRMALGDYKL